MPANYVLLEEITITTAAASVVLDNIPQTGYTDLKVVISARSSRSANQDDYSISLNGNTAAFSYRQLFGGAGSGSIVTGSASGTTGFVGIIPATNNTASTFGSQEIYIPNYTSNTNKSFSADSVAENNAATNWQVDLIAQLWSSTSAINSITFTSNTSNNFVVGSTFSLYGVAALGTTPVIAPKAEGGDVVVSDGTYWYHAFLSSGTFTPSQTISCDVLQIAGGGSGDTNVTAGGGAGGVSYLASQSVTATRQVVVVGAGAAGGNGFGYQNGSNSQFASLTAALGGGASGLWTNGNGVAGGSGGGGAGYTGTGGASLSSQGNAGGNGVNSGGGFGASGGGGGAGGVGGNASGSTPGAGGVGTTTYSSWGLATGTGQNVGGTVFYAGGGRGGGYTTSPNYAIFAGSNGGGGFGSTFDRGISGSQADGGAGLANTGGGGGGGGSSGGWSGNGGSGIVIVRYSVA
jgi:hypothetical protein